MPSTAGNSKPIDPDGELYQQRAFRALPILVRQALAAHTIYYSEVANELEMSNPRNMNYVLGSIGTSLRLIGAKWEVDIPPLQAIVINKTDELPGEGFAEFAPDPIAFTQAPRRVKKQIIDGLLSTVYSFPRWLDVLKEVGASLPEAPDLDDALPASVRLALGGAGESGAHLEFKRFVAKHPSLVGLHAADSTLEFVFPSSDTSDVMFQTPREYVAVEVKSRISPEYDLLRGVFQCVKYLALLDAVVAVERLGCDTRAVLVLEGEMPADVRTIANTLGVEVIDRARDRLDNPSLKSLA